MSLPSDIAQLLEAIPDAKSRYAISRAMDALVSTANLNAFTMLISSLPTTLPATSGQLWLNGGILCVS
jgi:aspartyl/asparaginyl beta-hydroxylase (cupin superfamily)